MDVVVQRCAGIDVRKDTVVICVRTPEADGHSEMVTKTFDTVTAELLAVRDWLTAMEVTLIDMESMLSSDRASSRRSRSESSASSPGIPRARSKSTSEPPNASTRCSTAPV